MDKLKDYNIAFKGLKDGKHHFHYTIGQNFFDCIEDSAIEKGDFEVDVNMIKNSQMLQFDFNIDGNVHTICDNCLGELTIPVTYNGILYVKFGVVYDEPSEEIIVLPHEEHEFNVAQLIYEFIVVSMPLRSIHKDLDSCDPEMKDKLKEFSSESHEQDNKEDEAIDPRWEALKKLKNNN